MCTRQWVYGEASDSGGNMYVRVTLTYMLTFTTVVKVSKGIYRDMCGVLSASIYMVLDSWGTSKARHHHSIWMVIHVWGSMECAYN